MTLSDIYFGLRLISWIVALITFWILAYKYVYNNWTGKVHQFNWPAGGVWAGTFMYVVGLGEVIFTQPNLEGGLRLWLTPCVALFWCYIAVFKIPLAKENKMSDWMKDIEQ